MSDAPRADAAEGECWKRLDICFGTDRCVPGLDCEADHLATDHKLITAVVAAAVAWVTADRSGWRSEQVKTEGELYRAVDAYEAASGGRG